MFNNPAQAPQFGSNPADDPGGLALKARAKAARPWDAPPPAVLAGTGVPGGDWDAFFQAMDEKNAHIGPEKGQGGGLDALPDSPLPDELQQRLARIKNSLTPKPSLGQAQHAGQQAIDQGYGR